MSLIIDRSGLLAETENVIVCLLLLIREFCQWQLFVGHQIIMKNELIVEVAAGPVYLQSDRCSGDLPPLLADECREVSRHAC